MDVRPVLVGVDGSDGALAATRWAAAEATRRGAPLRLVHGYLWPTHGHIGGVRLDADVEASVLQQTQAQLNVAAEAARAVAPELEVTTSVQVDGPVAAIVAESEAAQLVVVGSRGLGGFAALLLGSTGVAVAARAACPVVVIRGEVAEPQTGPIVVGVDGSPLGEAVIAFAFEVAAGRNAPVVAVHAWGDFVVQDGFGFGALAVDWDEVDREEHRVLDERLATWVEKYPEVQVERIVARDTPSRLLLRSAEGASLVVLGTRRRGGLSGLLLGSTSHALLHHASCPVAVIPSIPVD